MLSTLSKQQVKEQILAMVPKTCPSCDHTLTLSHDLMHLKCENPACTGKFYRKLEIMAKAFGIDNIGIKVAEEMVTGLDLTLLHQLYELKIEDILKVGRFQIGMATKIYNSIQGVTSVTWEQFIRGIQIARVGEGTSRELSKKIKDLDALLSISPERLARIMDRATVDLTKVIVASIRDQEEEIRELAKKVKIIYADASPTVVEGAKDLSNITAVITGSLTSCSRKEFEDKYNTKYGIKFGKSVSGNTKILICNEDAGTSSKAKAAAKLGVAVMKEEAFIAYVDSL